MKIREREGERERVTSVSDSVCQSQEGVDSASHPAMYRSAGPSNKINWLNESEKPRNQSVILL